VQKYSEVDMLVRLGVLEKLVDTLMGRLLTMESIIKTNEILIQNVVNAAKQSGDEWEPINTDVNPLDEVQILKEGMDV